MGARGNINYGLVPVNTILLLPVPCLKPVIRGNVPSLILCLPSLLYNQECSYHFSYLSCVESFHSFVKMNVCTIVIDRYYGWFCETSCSLFHSSHVSQWVCVSHHRGHCHCLL